MKNQRLVDHFKTDLLHISASKLSMGGRKNWTGSLNVGSDEMTSRNLDPTDDQLASSGGVVIVQKIEACDADCIPDIFD